MLQSQQCLYLCNNASLLPAPMPLPASPAARLGLEHSWVLVSMHRAQYCLYLTTLYLPSNAILHYVPSPP